MADIIPSRRGFLLGVTSVLAAPAIVRASSLMPIKAPRHFMTMDFGKDCGTVIWVRISAEGIEDRFMLLPAPVKNVDLRDPVRVFADSLKMQSHWPERADALS